MMRYSLFIGCRIPSHVPQYESAARTVLEKFMVDLIDMEQFSCCGHPMRSVDKEAFLLSAVRNLALSEDAGLDMLVLCNCCFGALKKAADIMKEDGPVQEGIRGKLREMGLAYDGKTRIRHYLSLLHDEIGIEALKEKLEKTYSNLNVAVQYGCHVLRPSPVTQFDDPVNPCVFDSLVSATGASSVDWINKLECCGAPLMGVNDQLSMELSMNKAKEAIRAEAGLFCTSCPYCQIQFDTVQEMIAGENPAAAYLPSVVFPQLLGLALGCAPESLGAEYNRPEMNMLASYLDKE